jgi:hypothetical protein
VTAFRELHHNEVVMNRHALAGIFLAVLAALMVLLVCLAVAAATRGRLPLWAALVGAGAMAGSYEAAYAADPTAFLAASPASATAVLLTVFRSFEPNPEA